MKLTGVNQLWIADITYIRAATGVRISGGDPGCLLTQGGRLGTGPQFDGTPADGRLGEGPSAATTGARRGASFRSRHSVCLWGLSGSITEERDESEHEPAG